MTALPHITSFTGTRICFESRKRFDEVLTALLEDVGKTPVAINKIAQDTDSWEAYKAEVQTHIGPGGFILFAILDHGVWIKKAGIDKKVLRLIIGNPLIAITLLRHDVKAGLFAPVELILVEEADGRSSLSYVKPSSLMVIEPNEPLLAAAIELDKTLEALVMKVTR